MVHWSVVLLGILTLCVLFGIRLVLERLQDIVNAVTQTNRLLERIAPVQLDEWGMRVR